MTFSVLIMMMTGQPECCWPAALVPYLVPLYRDTVALWAVRFVALPLE